MKKKVFAGDTLTWIDISEHLASDGWQLSCDIRLPNGTTLTVDGTDDGNGNWTFTVAASVTAAWTSAKYFFRKYAEKGTEKHTYSSGEFEVTDISTKSVNKKILEALEAALQRLATKEQTELTIAGRAIKYMTITEMMNARAHFQMLVDKEDQVASGSKMATGNKILISFM